MFWHQERKGVHACLWHFQIWGQNSFLSSRDGFTCCVESTCALVCHQCLSHWPVVNDRPAVRVYISSHFSFQMFSFLQILIFKPQIFLAGELECTLNCLSLNEGLWLWSMDAFWPLMIALAASPGLLNEWKFYNRVTEPTDKCLFWACSFCQTTKMLWSCVTLALWLDASLIHVLQNKHI